jgi:hypothetical protein
VTDPDAPAATPTRGEYAGPTPPQPPPALAQNGHAGAWIVVGPRTRGHLARVLEQHPTAAPALVALLETSGAPEGQGWRLVGDSCHLEPEPPQASPSAVAHPGGTPVKQG